MSRTPLWYKGGGDVDGRVQQFLAGEDVVLDRELFLSDIRASRAHVAGLGRIGVLAADEAAALDRELALLAEDFAAGRFALDERWEDGHSAIEDRLTERLGDAGKKVHTGRSRNDQVLVAQRLWLRDRLGDLDAIARASARACLERARADEMTPMPGYTHLQRAMPSSVGLWMGAFAESFADDAEIVRMARRAVDRSPLGTAAGYGINLPLDREGVARELGFARLQQNPMHAQNSRGKLELVALCALHQVLLDVRRLAWDLSLFTTAEFALVRLPDRHTTGSSIMPNKRNPDVVELLRAAAAVVEGATAEIQSILSLPSGYHRDLQGTKAPLMRAMAHGLEAAALVPDVIGSMELDRARMRAAVTPELHATDRAVELTRAGTPFRDAYRQVAAELEALAARRPEDSIAARVSPGACADLRLEALGARLDAMDRKVPPND